MRSPVGLGLVLVTRIVLAAVVLTAVVDGSLAGLLAGLLATQLLVKRRFAPSVAETIGQIVMTCLVLGVGFDLLGPSLASIAVIAAVAYGFNGLAKVANPKWRSGDYLLAVFRSRVFGLRRAATVTLRVAGAVRVMSWSLMLWELSFPVALLDPRLAFAYCACGLAFHVGTAIVMGLHQFPWAFAATYPAVLWFASAETIF
ncbi:MAG: hypothetical protein KDE27_16340 [Planctomycetes bacterium]|nr:hypothetical protein [Planctomycetota bacterium]